MEYFTAPLIIASVSGILAALISVVDMLANNYGNVEIDINNGKKKQYTTCMSGNS